MESNFTLLASGRSNEELIERIDNRQKFLPETVEASVAELQFRNHGFSDDELKIINEDIQAHRANAAMVTSNPSLFNTDYKNTIVEDPDAPLMYSRRVIYMFAFLFGAMFGSIMMAMNISKTEKKNEAYLAVIFGIGFTALQIYFMSRLNSNSGSSYGYLGGLISAYCLNYIFWKNFIGYSAFYRARTFWVPSIIAIVFSILVITAIFAGQPK